MKHTVIKVGKHSLAVIIPAKFAHNLGINAGDEVYIKTNLKTSRVTLSFPGSMQLPLKLEAKAKKKPQAKKKKK